MSGNKDNPKNATPSEEANIARLLVRSGSRPEPSVVVREKVHDAALDAWLALPSARAAAGHATPTPEAHVSPWWRRSWAIFALTGCLSLGLLTLWQVTPQPLQPVGNIVFSSGGYSVHPASAQGTELAPGTTLRTSDQGRLLVQLDAATSIRLDHNSQVTFTSADEVFLHNGRLYVDSAGDNDVRVSTTQAVVTKVGTQFEVAAMADELSVAVREGQVSVSHQGQPNGQKTSAAASPGRGELLRFSGSGEPKRQSISTLDDARWSWTQLSRPDFVFSDESLHDYLNWVARERGLTLTYAKKMHQQWADSERVDGRFDATDADIALALDATKAFVRLSGKPYELIIGQR